MKLAIIKYTAGNIQSVLYALQRLGVAAEVSDDANTLLAADKIIFPGVGEAGSAMQSLRESGLDQLIPKLKQPLLGICVGMQLLGLHSEEHDTDCLGILPVKVLKFKSTTGPGRLKVPQVGWNTIFNLKSRLFDGIAEHTYVYNVHSYYMEDSEHTIAHGHYGVPYAAAVQKDNFYGVQFHSEKSAAAGDRIIQNFLNLT